MTEWLHIRNGWPCQFAALRKAPAEFALGLLYLLRTEEAHRQNEDVLAAARIFEREYLQRLRQQSFGH